MDSLRKSPRWGNHMDPYNEGPDLELHHKGTTATYLKRRTQWLLSPARILVVVMAAVLTLVLVSPRMFTGRINRPKKAFSVSSVRPIEALSETSLKTDSQIGQSLSASGTQVGGKDTNNHALRPDLGNNLDLPYQLDEPVRPKIESDSGLKTGVGSALKPTTPEIPEPIGPALIRPLVPDYLTNHDDPPEDNPLNTSGEPEPSGVPAKGEIVHVKGLEKDQKQTIATESAALEQASISDSPSLPNEVNNTVTPTQSSILGQEGPFQEPDNTTLDDPEEEKEQTLNGGSPTLEHESFEDLEDEDYIDNQVVSENESSPQQSSPQRWVDTDDKVGF